MFDTTQDTDWAAKAQRSCSHAVTLNADLADTHLCQGIMQGGTGHYSEAVAQFQKVLDIEPANTFAYEGLANAQYNLKRISEAEATYQRAISVRPNYWAPYNWLGVLYLRTGENEKAAEMFRKVTKLDPGNHQAFYDLCGADFYLGKTADAEEMCKKSLAIRPNGTAYSNLGTLTFYQGHFDRSAEYFQKAVPFSPKDSTLWGNLGDAYRWSSHERAKAVPAYRKAAALAREGLRVNPKDYSLLGNLALYEAKSSNIKQAIRDLEKSLSLAPKNLQLTYNAALVYHLAGQQAKALDYLRRARDGGYPAQSIGADPEWKSMKGNPEFQQIIGSEKR
jgi:tetratricopeptide (TPR) repeat protein